MFWVNLLSWIGTHCSSFEAMEQTSHKSGYDYAIVVIKTASVFRDYEDVDSWLEGPVWARKGE